ncbi:MAG: hypothetical protein ACI4D3_07400, partial [Lachnospiraceae bacterium]
MKLKTKLTAICTVLLSLVAIALSGAMLWQVREQSYKTLTQRSEEKLAGLVNAFGEAVVRDYSTAGTPSSQKAVLQYCFRNCGVDGSVLAAMGELLSAPTQIDPRTYLDVHLTDGVQTARCSAGGKDYLIVGRAVELRQVECQVYLVSDASYIRGELGELLVRFLLLALCICVLGLIGVRWLI